MSNLICELKNDNIQEALELVWSVFNEFEAPEYSVEGINNFKLFIDYNSMIERISSGSVKMFGCFIDNKLVGIIALKEMKHICLLFVDKNYHRNGFARQLFQKALIACKEENSELKQITVNSSPYAVEVYQKLGFIATDTEQVVDGIRFTSMKFCIG